MTIKDIGVMRYVSTLIKTKEKDNISCDRKSISDRKSEFKRFNRIMSKNHSI